jgi:hypothetical protein
MRYMLLHCVRSTLESHPELGTEPSASLTSGLAEARGAGVLLDGGRLQLVGAKTVRVRHGEVLMTDGPFAETKGQVAGYDIVNCADLDEAVELASRHPTTMIGTIEIRPLLQE